MADLQQVFAEAAKLNQGISRFLKFSTYMDYDDLSGLDIDFADGEQLFLLDALRRITDRLADIQKYISYLSRPVMEVSRLRKGIAGKYQTAQGCFYDCGGSIEALVSDEYHHVPYWTLATVEHNGEDYYLVGYKGLSVKNGWMDKEHRVCIYFTQEDAMELMNCGKDKITRLFRELDQNGIGLIERKKQGQGRPARIYVKNLTLPADTSQPQPDQEPSCAPQTAEDQQQPEPLDNSAVKKANAGTEVVSDIIFLQKRDRPAVELLNLDVTDEQTGEVLESVPADPSVRNFSYTLREGKFYFRENSRMTQVDLGKKPAERVKGILSHAPASPAGSA